ncbi:MAG: rod shape-determining protein MreC [Alistipes sp.]|nr:rod shape-determining protein MreC [Alistipes sp.]
MIKFILFLKRIHFVLLFIVLEAFAIHYYAQSTSYTKARLITASNYMVGGVYSQMSGLNSYLHLKHENTMLMQQIAALQNELEGYRHRPALPDSVIRKDSTLYRCLQDTSLQQYAYLSAEVINNSLIRQENYITLNRGIEEGITPDMAVIADGGIVGYVIGCSDHFSVCMSVLNRNFKTSGRIKGSDFFGSVYWDGVSYEHVMLSEIPKYAKVQAGDTIVTTSYSSRFPPNVMIGTVESYALNNATYYDIRVKLHAKIAALNNVLTVKYLYEQERDGLEESLETAPTEP